MFFRCLLDVWQNLPTRLASGTILSRHVRADTARIFAGTKRAAFGGESPRLLRSPLAGDRRRRIGDGRPVPIATYELRFHIGEHFRRAGLTLPDPAFLKVVPIRFGVAEPEGPYHVPLVASPWSDQTYRGS